MINQLNTIIGGVVFIIIIGVGWYVKNLNDQVVTCNANTSIQKAKYETDVERYEKDINDIVKFYDSKNNEVAKFTRRKDETDCQASKRFLDNASY